MQIKNFPFCCAGKVLCDFGGTPITLGDYKKPSKEEIEKFINYAESSNNAGFFIIAINDEQNEFMEPILKKCKYTCIAKEIPSPNHEESIIFLYLKVFYI